MQPTAIVFLIMNPSNGIPVKIFLIIFCIVIISESVIGQSRVPTKKDSATYLSPKKEVNNKILEVKKTDIIREIEQKINQVMDKYVTASNNSTTWTLVKNEVDNLLYSYYRAGRLIGAKPEEAYFDKIGPDTMTAVDIANGKMILLTGVAIIKPAEFTMMRFERITTGK
jgi:hypothetical protein